MNRFPNGFQNGFLNRFLLGFQNEFLNGLPFFLKIFRRKLSENCLTFFSRQIVFFFVKLQIQTVLKTPGGNLTNFRSHFLPQIFFKNWKQGHLWNQHKKSFPPVFSEYFERKNIDQCLFSLFKSSPLQPVSSKGIQAVRPRWWHAAAGHRVAAWAQAAAGHR